jgi:hypothetical protein
MAYVNAYGIASAQSSTGAIGNVTYGAKGLADCATEVNGHANLTIGGLGLADCAVTALGQFVSLVKVVSAVPITANKIRVTFDNRMKKDAALLATYNYSVVPTTPGAAQVTVNEIQPENATNPLWVDLLTSEMTDGASYEASVSATGPTDKDGTPIDPNNNTVAFTGVGDAPEVYRVVPQSENRVDVIFNEAMKDNADILDHTRYVWDNGLTTLSVLEVEGDTVKLVTSNQTENVLYTLTITP